MTSPRSSARRPRSRSRASATPSTFWPPPAAEAAPEPAHVTGRGLSAVRNCTGAITPMLARVPEEQNGGTVPAEAIPLAADVFPGDATEGTTTIGDSASGRAQAARHSWRVLATLSTLMG